MTEPDQLEIRDLLPSQLHVEQTMKDALSQERGTGAAKLAWDVIGSQGSAALKSVLGLNVLDVLAGAWTAVSQLHEYTDRSKHPEGERSVVYLAGHKFVKTLYPQLTVTIEPLKPITLRFNPDLIADIQSIALAICNGCITNTGAGDGTLSAQLKYGSLALNKPQQKKVHFPGSFAFKAPGLAIR
jgi:hypothetical protein